MLNKIITAAQKKLSAKQKEIVSVFIKQFYEDVNWSDFADLTIDELCNRALSLWYCFSKRSPNEQKIRVFNPTIKADFWESKYTIIEVVMQDMPFIVDSLQMEINRLGYNIHSLVHLGGLKTDRDKQGIIQKIASIKSKEILSLIEAPIYIEIEKQTEQTILDNIKINLERILNDVQLAVTDYHNMRQRSEEIAKELEDYKPILENDEATETQSFLHWLLDNNFIFLGYRQYSLVDKKGKRGLGLISGSGLGVLRSELKSKDYIPLDDVPPEAHKFILSKYPVILSKTDSISTIHRALYTDSIIIKKFDENGEIIGAHRFVGLYSTIVDNTSLRFIPLIRKKLDFILKKFGFPRDGYASRTLSSILENFPRDDCFQTDVEELYKIATGIYQLHERRITRLFLRKDIYNRYVSCLVFLPRENFNTEIRLRIQEVLMNYFNGISSTFNILFSESILSRIHFVIRINPQSIIKIDHNFLENEIIKICSSWFDGLRESISNTYTEPNIHKLVNKYLHAFPAGYIEKYTPSDAMYDLQKMEKLNTANPLEVNFYKSADENIIGLKLFQLNQPILLSDVLPILENFGFKVISEESLAIKPKDKEASPIWISIYSLIFLQNVDLEIDLIEKSFQDSFTKIWNGETENDGINKLLLSANLSWREIALFRGYAKYLRQIRFPFTPQYIEEALTNNFTITKLILDLFKLRFDAGLTKSKDYEVEELKTAINKKLEEVSSLDEDRILNKFLSLVEATVRTNYYQNKPYLSFKFACKNISELPQPSPLFEIFVYSPRFEGTHLRMAKVARGGIRWSDRKEDFRTEILSLMKAQQVKNVVIVPYGAKGGFVLKKIPQDATRAAIQEEGIACYKNFINALLDLTDNIIDGKIVAPQETVCYDDEDPYLVVAADKGTASFSDIANSISKEHNFWLGDAFASGGSKGYDHKKIGITARGAWESVKYNFYELGIDTQTTDFSVIGIGDMSGDVFGNGMLLSEHIKLVAAFNHAHIFLDPNPDPKISFQERSRLFSLPQSTWEDYNNNLISKGGGVFKRSQKTIKLSAEIKSILDIKSDYLSPNELISSILKAPVDLLWNGGIGTYVKASSESHENVGDRNNDVVRINGSELRCKVIGEGGNLGFTQLGRIEYSLQGGIVNADFIDNSGGVDCSDHEVNIKILLNSLVAENKLSEKRRDTFLAEMTDEVADLVLKNNYRQVRTISSIVVNSFNKIEIFSDYINQQEHSQKINRELEFLPNTKTLLERKTKNLGLTRPEVAILLAYSKLVLKEELLKSDISDIPYLHKYLLKEFPQKLIKKYDAELPNHRLRREVICTQLSNDFITNMGITFIYETTQETGASTIDIIKAYVIADELFAFQNLLQQIEALDFAMNVDTKKEIITKIHILLVKTINWFLNNYKQKLSIDKIINDFKEKFILISKNLNKILESTNKNILDSKILDLAEENISHPKLKQLIENVAINQVLLSALNIIKISLNYKGDLILVAKIYFALEHALDLFWLHEKINTFPAKTSWQKTARSLIKNDLDRLECALCVRLLKYYENSTDINSFINNYLIKMGTFYDRWKLTISEIRQAEFLEFDIIYIVIREIFNILDIN